LVIDISMVMLMLIFGAVTTRVARATARGIRCVSSTENGDRLEPLSWSDRPPIVARLVPVRVLALTGGEAA
jgi:hypothetical protein